jgi:hypothetical protein
LTTYWVLLIGSLVLAIVFLLIGDIVHGILDGFFHPLLVLGTLAVISGTGILLTKYTDLNAGIVLAIGFGLGVIAYILIYYFLIIPISHAEMSSVHSAREYEGQIAEVTTTIPATGYGEILIASPTGSRSETARSFDHIIIPSGDKVVVVHVDAEGICFVSSMEDVLT